MGMGGRIGRQGGYGQPQYGGGYPAGPGKGRAPMAQPAMAQPPELHPYEEKEGIFKNMPPTAPPPIMHPMPFSSYGSPGKGMRPQPYGGGFGRGFGGGFGGYQPSPYMPPSPYGGSFGGVFNQGYGVPRGIGSLLSSYPSYMPPRLPPPRQPYSYSPGKGQIGTRPQPFNPYVR